MHIGLCGKLISTGFLSSLVIMEVKSSVARTSFTFALIALNLVSISYFLTYDQEHYHCALAGINSSVIVLVSRTPCQYNSVFSQCLVSSVFTCSILSWPMNTLLFPDSSVTIHSCEYICWNQHFLMKNKQVDFPWIIKMLQNIPVSALVMEKLHKEPQLLE